MRKILCLSYGLFSALSLKAQLSTATISTTNSFSIHDAFARKLEFSSENATLDRFGSRSQIGWIREYDRLGYNALDSINSSGRNLMQRSVVNGLRETAAALPFTKGWQEWAENLYIGSIGNTAEEQLNTSSATPSPSEVSWWRQIKADGNLNYGIRFDDPSAYATVRIGHWLDNPALILHGKLYYRPFENMRMDLNMIAPLPYGEVSGGISFNPTSLDGQSDTTASIRFSHGLLNASRWSNSGRIADSLTFFVGASYNQREANTTVETGLSFNLPWGKQ